jgi:CRP-like cAMP-binding protein
MYFGDYSLEMFQKLCPFIWYKTYNAKQKIFEKEDKAKWFYYILKGTIHIIDPNATEGVKIAKMHNENEVFGMKKIENSNVIEERGREAVAETSVVILKIDLQEYETIRKQKVLSAAEAKINYLTRHVPGLRSVDKQIVEEIETMFQKEKYTKGFRINEQGKLNDNIYFIVSGEWRILYYYNSNKKLKEKFDSLDTSMPGYLLIGKLTSGDWFGQTSAVCKEESKFSIQADSDEVVVYKISWSTFYSNFGKDSGQPVKKIRAKAVIENNWIYSVLKLLNSRPLNAIISSWEFVDRAHDPQSTWAMENESPFLK